MQEGIEAFATEKAKSDLNMATRLVDYKYSGATGDTVTFFQGERRVATNVMLKGKRAVGTKVSVAASDQMEEINRLNICSADVQLTTEEMLKALSQFKA
ncbi:cache domain-containing protein [Paenibacillus sp. TY11]|uniref:cache domain-containing protein n=1 Tax=Paenibacillus sp. TY11 TaxID=3448633 RepID=UPI004039B05E